MKILIFTFLIFWFVFRILSGQDVCVPENIQQNLGKQVYSVNGTWKFSPDPEKSYRNIKNTPTSWNDIQVKQN